MQTVFEDWGLSFTEVDTTDLNAVGRVVGKVTGSTEGMVVLWIETPSNPRMKVSDEV